MKNLDREQFHQYWNVYKSEYALGNELSKNEIYKWEIFNQVYQNWDWNVTNRASMIRNAFSTGGSSNLWASGNYFPIRMLDEFLIHFPNETVEAFEILFDQNQDLIDRIISYRKSIDQILKRLQLKFPDREKMNAHYQDIRIISIYLMLQHPESYIFYKYNIAKDLFQVLNLKGIKKGSDQSFIAFNSLAQQIKSFILEDVEFIEQYKLLLDHENLFSDPNFNLLTQDFIFRIVNYITKDNTIEISKELKQILIHQKNHLQSYFDVMDKLVDALDLEPNSDQYYFNYDKKDNRLVFTIGQRYIWRIENEGFKNLSKEPSKDVTYEFTGNPVAYTNRLKHIDNPSDVLFQLIEASQQELDRTSLSGYRKNNKLDFQALVFQKEFRKSVFETLNISSTPQHVKTYTALQNIPLNQILYGPPGTGKTYHTINKAIKIANPSFDLNQDRSIVKAEYNRLVNEGQIAFTTFHQSMSYEDFIEGIKPEIEENEEGSKSVIYEIKDGIFKSLCKNSNKVEQNINEDNFEESWNKLIELVKEQISEEKLLKLGSWEYSLSSKESLKYSSLNSPSQYSFTITKKNILDTYQNKQARPSGAFQKDMVDIVNYMKVNFGLIDYQESHQLISIAKNHVLIIDEINRGNVSQIFGELITLIEEDKRIGNVETLEVTLPYSKEKFGVPNNLYIIGTMNTADRSVEALDTALRRRFSFTEMLPNPAIIESLNFTDFPRAKIMKNINERIELLLDRNYMLGHAYFIKDNFKHSFENEIIPLLQEYFYNDYSKIGLVLGKGFVRIKATSLQNVSNVFADFETIHDIDLIKTYELIPFNEINFEEALSLLIH